MSFAKNLRTERKKLGLSAEELAKLVRVSRSYITLLESGKRSPTKTIVAKITKGLKIKNWVIKYLNEMNNNEVEDRNAVLGSIQEAHNDVVKRIDNLVRLKISPQNTNGELLSDDEFKNQKDSLMKEKSSLEEKLKDNGERINKWVELSEKTFNFACYAKYWFSNGNLQTKRQILQSLGQNLTLKDKIVRIELEKPLQFIKEARQEVAEISPIFEPEKEGYTTAQLGAYYSQNPSLLPRVGSNHEPSPYSLPKISFGRGTISYPIRQSAEKDSGA